MLYLTSTPPFTSMLFLGFNAVSHFNASLHFDAELTSSVTLFFLNVSLNLTSTLPFTSMLFLGFNALSHFKGRCFEAIASKCYYTQGGGPCPSESLLRLVGCKHHNNDDDCSNESKELLHMHRSLILLIAFILPT